MKNPLVSILIPFKNTERFLIECFESICAQTYANWEVIAVDDHSTDSSKNLAEGFTIRGWEITVIPNDGNGIIDALRTAYSQCKGQLITRMDCDDIMAPNKLQVMVNGLLANGKGHLAIGQVEYFSKQGIGAGYARYAKWLNALTTLGSNYSEIYKECAIPSPCWMVFKKDLEACGAFNYDRYPEDYDLAFRFYEKGLKCIPCHHILHHWRDYDNRTSRTSEHYAQNYFLDIKLHYFLKLDRNANRPLVLWGAGNKGKKIAKSLRQYNVTFHWVCDNPKKIGKEIYGQQLFHFRKLKDFKNPQSIVTVANPEEQVRIKNYFETNDQKQASDYHFFC